MLPGTQAARQDSDIDTLHAIVHDEPAVFSDFFFSSRRRHTRCLSDWSSDVCSSDLWPLAAHAQQPAIPVIGYLDSRSPDAAENRLRGFRQGLKDAGYIEGENITIVYRWADDRVDRLPLLAAELVSRSVAAIVTAGVPTAFAAKAATTTIPIVSIVGNDPVQLGLVGSLSRPGGNLTGINVFTSELAAKRLEVLRDLLPQAKRVGVLVNPADAGATDSQLKDIDAAARAMALQSKFTTRTLVT